MNPEKINHTSKLKLVICIIIILFVIIPISISIIFIILNNSIIPSKENAFQNDINQDIIQNLESQNINTKDNVMHELAREGEWIAITSISTSPTAYGDSTLIVVHKENDFYLKKYFGTGYSKDSLKNLGVPDNLINQIMTNSRNDKYTEIISNSEKNPVNKYPLTQKLPYYSDKLKITYSFQDSLVDVDNIAIPIIHIDGSNAAQRSLGISKIRNFGYDPGDYKIEFSNFVNPFTGGNK